MSAPATQEDGALAASRKAFASARGSDALDALGWWGLLSDPPEAEMRAEMHATMLALFRAQGLALGDTCALGALLARPYLRAESGSGKVVAAIRRVSPRRGPIDLVVGDVTAVDAFLLDSPGDGARVIRRNDATLRPVDVAGRLTLNEVVASAPPLSSIPEDVARAARARSLFLGRVAATFEILGAAEAALALAAEYSTVRVQFGDPIAKFQAVRHLLAWARTDCAAIEALALQARDFADDAPERLDEIAKAIAGRNGRRACERSLQVLGAIGFTAEHEHHHFHGRVLVLDALLGSSADLTHGLGAWLRESGRIPDLPGAFLLPDATLSEEAR